MRTGLSATTFTVFLGLMLTSGSPELGQAELRAKGNPAPGWFQYTVEDDAYMQLLVTGNQAYPPKAGQAANGQALKDNIRAAGLDPLPPAVETFIDDLVAAGQARSRTLAALERIACLHPDELPEIVGSLAQILAADPDALASDAGRLIEETASQIAYPSAATYQGNHNTCGAAATQAAVAIEDPVGYAASVAQFATEGGAETCADPIPPNNTWEDDPYEPRPHASAMIQNAYAAQASGAPYDSSTDYEANPDHPTWGPWAGLSAGEITGLQNSARKVDGACQTDQRITVLGYSSSDLMGFIEDEIARCRPVVAMNGDHAFLIVGIDRTTPGDPHAYVSTVGQLFRVPFAAVIAELEFVMSVDDEGSDDRTVPEGQQVVLSDLPCDAIECGDPAAPQPILIDGDLPPADAPEGGEAVPVAPGKGEGTAPGADTVAVE